MNTIGTHEATLTITNVQYSSVLDICTAHCTLYSNVWTEIIQLRRSRVKQQQNCLLVQCARRVVSRRVSRGGSAVARTRARTDMARVPFDTPSVPPPAPRPPLSLAPLAPRPPLPSPLSLPRGAITARQPVARSLSHSLFFSLPNTYTHIHCTLLTYIYI